MSELPQEKACPRCGTVNPVADLAGREYRCAGCGLEQAHLDTAANGAIRGLFGWLLQPGDLVAERYRVTAVLGKGGFGVTYLVEDQRVHGKKRALKEIPELLFDEHETRLLGRLQHPAIPDITDRLTDHGMVYLVLEFGGSRTLRTEQERYGGRIPIGVLLPWVEEICSALIYLHAQNPPVVHRDLKPDNVLLDDNSRVMLIDFGIAKESAPETVTRTLGRAVTHGYSPPEQVLGTGTDARSDVYALGAILYSMLTGQVPTPAHERVVGKVLEPASHFVADIPPLLDAAIQQALELNINFRQQSVEDLARVLGLMRHGGEGSRTVLVSDTRALAAQLSTSSGDVRLSSVQLSTSPPTGGTAPRAQLSLAQPAPPTARPARRSGGAIAAVLVLAVLGGGGWWWWQQREEARASPGQMAASVAPAAAPAEPAAPAPASAGDDPTGVAASDAEGADGPRTSPAAQFTPEPVPGRPASTLVQEPPSEGPQPPIEDIGARTVERPIEPLPLVHIQTGAEPATGQGSTPLAPEESPQEVEIQEPPPPYTRADPPVGPVLPSWPSSASAKHEPKTSLLDEFDKHRRESLEKVPDSAPLPEVTKIEAPPEPMLPAPKAAPSGAQGKAQANSRSKDSGLAAKKHEAKASPFDRIKIKSQDTYRTD